MLVFVTGASGFVGSAVTRELIAAGHRVLGLVRSDASAASLIAAGAEIQHGSLEDLESLKSGAASSDGTIHTAFIHDFSNYAASCEIDKRAIETLGMALAGSDRPLIVTSGTALLAPGRIATEDDVREPAAGSFPRVPSAPRWELDVVAYRARDNSLKVVECKSYLDSPGVRLRGFDSNHADGTRYKLFNSAKLRDTVFNRLCKQFEDTGAALPGAVVQLCLACGRIASEADRLGLRKHFDQQGWELWDETWLRDHLKEMSDGGYENQVTAVVAKLLLRGKGHN